MSEAREKEKPFKMIEKKSDISRLLEVSLAIKEREVWHVLSKLVVIQLMITKMTIYFDIFILQIV